MWIISSRIGNLELYLSTWKKKKTKTKKTLQAKIELMRERFLGSFSHVFH